MILSKRKFTAKGYEGATVRGPRKTAHRVYKSGGLSFVDEEVWFELAYMSLTPLRALIVDDEPMARQILRDELELIDSLTVVGEAAHGEEALLKISALKPNLVVLDIEMPVMDGFDLINNLQEQPVPAIVMVTAYDQYALKAFQAGAIDYLLKPFKAERLREAVERARRVAIDPVIAAEKVQMLQQIAQARQPATAAPRKIVGKHNEEYFLLNPAEVLAFQADGSLVWIVTLRRRFLATQNLKTLEERLKDTAFRRVHRNALVNVEQIRKMSMISSQRWLITMNNGQELIVSKRQAKTVREVLQW